MCLAFGVDRLDELGDKVSSVLEMQPPQGIGDKLRALGKLKSLADSRPHTVSSGPCQELVLDQPDLDRLPIATCWPGDGGPFITLPSVFTKDPHTGGRNVGMYRLQKRDAASTGLHWQIHKDAAADWREGAGRMEVAVSIGSDPITAYAGSCPAPKHVDELMVAGFLRGKAVEVVQCKTVDLQVPARAEIVLEGYCERGELADEGPFGDHTGYYTPAEPFPVLRLTCMTMRRDAIYPSILVGPPPAEDAWLGKATERLFLPALRATLPELVDYDLPVAGAFHNCCIVSIRKAYPGHARKVMHAVWGTGLLSLTKMVIVVDEWVNVHDYGEVAWQVGANVDPGRDVEQARGPLDQLDHAPSLQSLGGKLGLDATEDVARRGLPARMARGRAHERRGARAGRRALGLARDRAAVAPGRPRLRRPGGAADGAARSGPGRESLPRPARDPALRGRGLARARARPPPGGDRRHARRRARLGGSARRTLAHARDDGLLVRARPQLERAAAPGRWRSTEARAAGRRSRPRDPRRAPRRARRLARRRSRPRHGGALRACDRGGLALGRAAARARRPPARRSRARPGCGAQRSPSRPPTPCARSCGWPAPTQPIRPATTSRARTARPTATCWHRSRARTAGARAWSTRASQATSSRAWR